MRTVRNLPLQPGQRVLLRVDVNVPIESGQVASSYRLLRALPTIRYLLKKRAAVIILGHLGRPDGRHRKRYSLAPVAAWLGAALNQPVRLCDPLRRRRHARALRALTPGTVVMMENLRFYVGEQASDQAFAERLAALGDAYVNDAFGACHRADASISLLPLLMPAAAGPLLAEEVRILGQAVGKPRRPLVAVIGGAKLGSKLPLLKHLLEICDRVLVGGAMANTLLAAAGQSLGASPVEHQLIKSLKKLVVNPKLQLPVDVVVRRGRDQHHVVAVDRLQPRDVNYDVGPRTVHRFLVACRGAKTIIWNGPLGKFEQPPYHFSTYRLAKELVQLRGRTVVGGGETVQCLEQLGLLERYDFVSTGGGAMLEFLAGQKLPGLQALGYYRK